MYKIIGLCVIGFISCFSIHCSSLDSDKLNAFKGRIDSLQIELFILNNKVSSLTDELRLHKDTNDDTSVDLYSQSIQDIGNGFKVVKIETTENITGLKITGRIINATALRHENIEFRIKIAYTYKTFHVGAISSGSSTIFRVDVPDIPKESKYAEISYISSSIRYIAN